MAIKPVLATGFVPFDYKEIWFLCEHIKIPVRIAFIIDLWI